MEKIEALNVQFQPEDQYAPEEGYQEDGDNFDFGQPEDLNNLGLLDDMDG